MYKPIHLNLSRFLIFQLQYWALKESSINPKIIMVMYTRHYAIEIKIYIIMSQAHLYKVYQLIIFLYQNV